ncbi:MAG: HNH endonuclease [Hydrogenophaga sp.]|uniref:HNH endonuclease n=1 Tax=Hydrogenophaga sp. TaxID=1904254 RepID=UPI0027375C9F|nr:HNH endonuclease [Hydrogenophaga sp.]MDP3349458.1 HNH endonuclease [Hydrogenophaga sp.]
MPLMCLIPSFEWDSAIFKRLANNDTKAAIGNQAGVVIPKFLRPFFPGLLNSTSSLNPTIDALIHAELFDGNNYLGSVDTRYQYQTWGGTRNPESRITNQLGAIRKIASGGDYLIIRRKIESLHHYQLVLIRKTSTDYTTVSALAGSSRWGVLQSNAPMRETDLLAAQGDEQVQESGSFQLFDSLASTTISMVKRIARSLAFRISILSLYDERCSICGQALQDPKGFSELDAAHVVPRALLGSNDARNGFALCKRHHWAFDKGLIGVSDARLVVVPTVVKAMKANQPLVALEGNPIREASASKLRVNAEAFKWHRDNMLIH